MTAVREFIERQLTYFRRQEATGSRRYELPTLYSWEQETLLLGLQPAGFGLSRWPDVVRANHSRLRECRRFATALTCESRALTTRDIASTGVPQARRQSPAATGFGGAALRAEQAGQILRRDGTASGAPAHSHARRC